MSRRHSISFTSSGLPIQHEKAGRMIPRQPLKAVTVLTEVVALVLTYVVAGPSASCACIKANT